MHYKELSKCKKLLFFLIPVQELGQEVDRLTRVSQASRVAVSTLGIHEVPRKGGGRSGGKVKALSPYLECSLYSKALQGKRNFWTVTTEFQAFQRAQWGGNLSSPDPALAREARMG